MAGLTDLKKHQFIPFLDTAKSMDYSASEWKRIDLSTIFELTVNEESESYDYICYENPVEEVTKNAPELPQEIKLVEGNPIYDFMFNELFELPTGEACKIPFLICFGGTAKKAWRGIATVTGKVLNTPDRKLSFNLMMGGDIQKGTYELVSGAPKFTESGASPAMNIMKTSL